MALRSRAGSGGNRDTEGSRRFEHEGETTNGFGQSRKTSERTAAKKQKTGRLNRAKGRESNGTITQSDDRCFFLHFMNKSTKLMVYIFIFIYLKCNMVQKYRRSAAPRYIYKINTPFRQNKLQQNQSDIIGK